MLQVNIDTHLGAFHLDANFSAKTGKTIVLLGESGSGKTSVLRVLAGLQVPQQGYIALNDVVYFDSRRHIHVPPQERPFGYTFQDYVLFPHLNVFENVAFGLRAQRISNREIRLRVQEALERVQLTNFERRQPTQLSGGQQQRVALARALVLQPQLLLLDEPLSALDVQTKREVRDALRRILMEIEVTTVMVTHQYLEALIFGHQIIVLDSGQIVQQGDQRNLLEHPRSSYIAELAGMNFFRGELVRYEAEALGVIRVENGAHSIEIVATLKEQVSKTAPLGQEVYVVVEPRSIALYRTLPETSIRNIFFGEIIVSVPQSGGFIGSDDEGTTRVSIQIEPGMPPLIADITMSSARRLQLDEGQYFYAAFKATEARAYT